MINILLYILCNNKETSGCNNRRFLVVDTSIKACWYERNRKFNLLLELGNAETADEKREQTAIAVAEI